MPIFSVKRNLKVNPSSGVTFYRKKNNLTNLFHSEIKRALALAERQIKLKSPITVDPFQKLRRCSSPMNNNFDFLRFSCPRPTAPRRFRAWAVGRRPTPALGGTDAAIQSLSAGRWVSRRRRRDGSGVQPPRGVTLPLPWLQRPIRG